MTAEGNVYSSRSALSKAALILSLGGGVTVVDGKGAAVTEPARAAARTPRGKSTRGRIAVSMRRKILFLASTGSTSPGLPAMPSDGPRKRNPPGQRAK